MKLLLLIAVCFCGTVCIAQIDSDAILKKKIQETPLNTHRHGQIPNGFSIQPRQEVPLYKDPLKQPGLYFLPQDGMPCLVPDVSELAVIPNAFMTEVVAGAIIPNAAKPVFPQSDR